MTITTVHEIWGKGRGTNTADEQRWLVASYADAELANTHAVRCRMFLEAAAAKLPASLLSTMRDIAFDRRANPFDPKRPPYLLFDSLQYEIVHRELQTTVPELDLDNLWPALDVLSEQCENMIFAAQVQWMRDEVQEGAPPEPAPEPAQLAWRLWQNGFDPDKPAINAMPGESGAKAFKRLMQAALDEARANRRRVPA